MMWRSHVIDPGSRHRRSHPQQLPDLRLNPIHHRTPPHPLILLWTIIRQRLATVFVEIFIDLEITLIGTPSPRCNRRSSTQSRAVLMDDLSGHGFESATPFCSCPFGPIRSLFRYLFLCAQCRGVGQTEWRVDRGRAATFPAGP